MIESQYTSNIHKRLPRAVYSWKVNDNLTGGVPDAFYRLKSGGHSPLWVEYKFIKDVPKRDSTRIIPKLSAQQKLFLKQAHASGENAAVIIGCENLRHNQNPTGVILLTPDEWDNGLSKQEFISRAHGMDYVSVAKIISRLLQTGSANC